MYNTTTLYTQFNAQTSFVEISSEPEVALPGSLMLTKRHNSVIKKEAGLPIDHLVCNLCEMLTESK